MSVATSRTGVGAAETVVRGVRSSPQLRVGLVGTLILALIATAGRAVVPVAVQRTIDDGFGAGGVDVPTVTGIVVAAGVAVVITAAASAAMHYRLASVVESALAALRTRAFRRIHDLSVLHQAEEERGSLVARVTADVDEVSRFMQWAGLNLITALGQLTIAAVVMLVYSWQLAFVVFAVFVPFVVAARAFQRRLTVAFLLVRERVGRLLSALSETVVGAWVIRAYGIEEHTQHRVDAAIEAHRCAAVRAGRMTSVFAGAGEVFAAFATAAALVAGVWLGVGGEVSAGTVVAFLFLITLFVEPVVLAAEVVNEGQSAVAGWRRTLDVLDREPDLTDPGADGVDLPPGALSVGFSSVRFRYPGSDNDAVSGIDVAIAAGSRIAVVGETGSGKSTFAKLLTRLMDPSEGAVHLGGVPLRRVRFASLRRRVVIVPQDGALFDGVIADNVRMGDPQADDAGVTAVFERLDLAEWLAELPAGLETRTGERGAALSAGERQLVALARAAIADPDLLVLDEATSAVDPATDQRLQRAVTKLAAGRTVVTVAHRLSTAMAADEVLVFDGGRLVERGAHDDLVAADAVYAGLYASWLAGVSR